MMNSGQGGEGVRGEGGEGKILRVKKNMSHCTPKANAGHTSGSRKSSPHLRWYTKDSTNRVHILDAIQNLATHHGR